MSSSTAFPVHNALIHFDADSFFASCEQATHPEYRGKPVVTGLERGIATAMSKEAKARGVTRGMPLHQIKIVCPDAIIVPDDYETYSLFSKRMFHIVREYTSLVEEYGIDEGFADITGLCRPLKMSYAKIACAIKHQIQKELNITVSIGLAPTKVLAKAVSSASKPNGYATLSRRGITPFLKTLPVRRIWGVGPNTAVYMNKLGIKTAYDFVQKSEAFVKEHFTKTHYTLWHELQGTKVYEVIPEEKTSFASISKVRTFTPPQSDMSHVFAELVKNIEGACIKARQYKLVGKRMTIFLKTQQFERIGIDVSFSRATAFPTDIVPLVRPLFERIFKPGVAYRATGCALGELQADMAIQGTLFESPVELAHTERLYAAIDAIGHKFGGTMLHLGSSLYAHVRRRAEKKKLHVRKKMFHLIDTTKKKFHIHRVPTLSASLK